MSESKYFGIGVSASLVLLGGMAYSGSSHNAVPAVITPANLHRIGTVDERFQSYNIEMVEVIGGRFWRPYKDTDAIPKRSASAT